MLPASTTKITYDRSERLGKIKAMHGVGQPPIKFLDCTLFKYLRSLYFLVNSLK